MVFTEVLTNSEVWVEATAVRLDTSLGYHLLETAGGSNNPGSVASGTYTKATFATALAASLTSNSANGFTYTVSSDQINYVPLPNTSPTKFGSSFSVSFSGTGTFLISIP